MTRFDITQWSDFVRGVAEPSTEREMSERLASGDKAARRAVDVLARVKAVAEADMALAIPEHAIRLAKAVGSLRRPEAETVSEGRWRFLPFKVVFDSLRQPALAGTRDSHASHRQLTLEAEHFTVELRVEHDAEPQGTVVVGQVLEDHEKPRPVSEVPVLIVVDGRVVGRAVTSRFGEFHAAGLPQEGLELHVLVSPEERLAIPLTGSETSP